jgi:phosphotransferase system HPr-like phosphotransfer protein
MSARRLDPDASRVVIHTRAEGLMARLAHDLELRAEGFEGQLHVEEDGQTWSGALRFPVAGLRVVGARKGEHVDEGALSATDRKQIHDKIQSEILAGREVLVRVNGKALGQGQGVVRIPRGQHRLHFELERDEEAKQVSGEVKLSLERLGIAPIRGPLGAFRVADEISIHFRLVWR